jgi:predicted membrane protein (TIGR00267 family)
LPPGQLPWELGGFLAAKTDAEHYASETARESDEIDHLRELELTEVAEILRGYGLAGEPLKSVVGAITADRQRWIEFMMRFELGLERPDPRRALISALTIGSAYIVGGLVPLVPYMMSASIGTALKISVLTTGFALIVFGAIKGYFTGVNLVRSALQTLVVGGLAAAAAFSLAHAFG